MSNNDNNQQHEIVPDAPIMRSMMVRSAAPSIPLRSEPLAKPQPFATRTTKQRVTTKDSSAWSLNEATVMPLPLVYMLERTHVTVDASPTEVAKRVSDCLRRESIFACYSNKEVRVLLPDKPFRTIQQGWTLTKLKHVSSYRHSWKLKHAKMYDLFCGYGEKTANK